MISRGIVGNYIVERELGRGGMGVVYAAKHRVLGRPAAIKVLLANTIEARDRVERFFNEARAAMAIKHPNVVEVFDVGIDADGSAYIAMELLDGVSLGAMLAGGPLPLRKAVEFARQIADALAAAHDAGVIHRDLKPENIIVARERPILVDFGIAKLAGPVNVRTATGALIGTPTYMSPEQCEGLRELDPRSDLYSLGCVLFAMLVGRPPFESGGLGDVIGKHLHVPPPLLRTRCPAASAALEQVVSVLLAKSRDDRFASARAAAAALAAPEVVAISGPIGVAATADFPAVTQRTADPSPTAVDSRPLFPRSASHVPSGPGVQISGPPSPLAPPRARATVGDGASPHRARIVAVVVAGGAAAAAVFLLGRSCASGPSESVSRTSDAAAPVVVIDAPPEVVLAPRDAAITDDDLRALLPKHGSATPKREPERTAPRVDPRRAGSGSAIAKVTEPERRKPEVTPEPPAPAPQVHESVVFPRGESSSSAVPADVAQRVVDAWKANPSRKVLLTPHVEDDEPGVLTTLGIGRANAVLLLLTSGSRIPRDRIQMGSVRIGGRTPDGSGRRVDIDLL